MATNTELINIIDGQVDDWVKPVFILDIDGTINPYSARLTLQQDTHNLHGFSEHQLIDSKFGRVSTFLNRGQLLKNLERLHPLVHFLWGSAWNENSNLINRMIYRDETWPTIIFPTELEYPPNVKTWKLSTVKDYVETHYSPETPIIWLDDEIYDDALSWINNRPGGGLLIRPERHRGLTSENWDEIYEYAKRIKEEQGVS